MYAVIRAGGKQYRVAPGDVIQIDRALSADGNGNVQFASGDVLAISSESGKIAKPNGNGATVTAEILEQGRSSKVLVFKFKRKKQYKKMQGHRQAQTTVRITEISYGDQKATAAASQRKWVKRASTNLASGSAKVETAAEGRSAKAAAPAKKSAKKSSAKKSSAKKTASKSAAKKSSKKK